MDITSMGDSSKRGVADKIGQFDSGLKYAIALLLRNEVNITIYTRNLNDVTTYEFSSDVKKCDKTSKEKELIVVTETNYSYLPEDNGSTTGEVKTHTTGFAKALGYNWEPWMAFRELFSNMLDEGPSGAFFEQNVSLEINGTKILLSYKEGSVFDEVVLNRDKYILSETGGYRINDDIVMSPHNGNTLIYKNNILVYEDKRPSRFKFNIQFGELDERRVLSDISDVERTIFSAMMSTPYKDTLQQFLLEDFEPIEGEFLSKMSHWDAASNTLYEVAKEIYEKEGSVGSYPGVMEAIRKRPDCVLPGRVIRTINDSMWSYSKNVTIEAQVAPVEELLDDEPASMTPKDEIEYLFNFKVEVPVMVGPLGGGRVVADKYNKCIVISDKFIAEKDFPEFLVQYIDLTQSGNVLSNLSVFTANLLKNTHA